MTDQQTFQILQISSFSDHPVRNSANEFIFGNHVLWEANKSYVDGDGSIAPNVFSYDFTSPLASNSTLNVIIKGVNHELLGKDFFLHGFLDGKKILQSQVPITETAKEIAVCVVEPESSPDPVAIMGDFTWEIAPKDQNSSGDKDVCSCEVRTRLELWWIAMDIHEIFYADLSGIPISFLRSQIDYWGEIAQSVFSRYSKIYDSTYGRSYFGVTGRGGHFQHTRYIAKRTPNSPVGSLYRQVNCYDQAAMFQIQSSIKNGTRRTSWLFMQPFGFINSTHLVGLPGPCNNPFFKSNGTPPLVHSSHPQRTSFGNHVFNGALARFNPAVNDPIFDACSGPHRGTDHVRGYLTASIDRTRSPHGTVGNITQYVGVITTKFGPLSFSTDLKVDGEKLLQKYTTGNSKPCSQAHWDDVSQWIKTVLGHSCDVLYHDTNIGDGVAAAFWTLSGIDGVEGDVAVQVRVETCAGPDGSLDYEKSSHISFNDLLVTLIDVELDLGPDYESLHNIWTPAPFGDNAKYALQYAPHIPEGRVLLVSGNVLIDISGGSSSSSLEPLVQKLLAYTTVNTVTPLSSHIPYIPDYSYEIPETNKTSSPNEVKGLYASFDVKCHVDDLVAAATAEVEGLGILLKQYKIETNEVNKTSIVTFTFVTREVGVHDINLHFEEASTMNAGAKKIQVTVVNA